LEWPSLSVEWWVEESQTHSKDKSDTTLCHLTYGTHTSGEEKNYLIMAKVYLPNQENIRKAYADSTLNCMQNQSNQAKQLKKMTMPWRIK